MWKVLFLESEGLFWKWATVNLNFVDEATPDAVGNPLPQFEGVLLLRNEELPELVSNSSGDIDDQDLEPWCTDDVNFLSPLHLGNPVGEPTAVDPSDANYENKKKGVPKSLPNIVARTSEIITPEILTEALTSLERYEWQGAMAAKIEKKKFITLSTTQQERKSVISSGCSK